MAKKKKLQTTSTSDLQAELRRRQRRLPTLERRRERLLAQLDEVDAEIAELGGGSGGGRGKRRGRAAGSTTRRKRPKNEMSLGDALAKVMKKGQPRKVGDLAAAVQKAGYKTNSSNFNTIVNQTLLKDDRFKNTSRGHYALK